MSPQNPEIEEQPLSVLVVDAEAQFLNSLKSDPKAKDYPVLGAEIGKTAQLIIAEPKNQIMAIFINPTVIDPGVISVIRSARYHRPATPIYLLKDKSANEVLNETQVKNLNIREILEKPVTYKQMLEIVGSLPLTFDPKEALELCKANTDPVGKEVTAEDKNFVSIHAENYISGSKCLFDIYLMVSSGRYLKLLQGGDQFKPEAIQDQIKKEVRHFYIKKEVHPTYLAYCDHITSQLLSNKNTPFDIKVHQVFNQGDETLNFIKNAGVSEPNLRYAHEFISNVGTLIEQIPPENNQYLRIFFANVSMFDHSVGTAVLAGLLCRSLEIRFDRLLKTIGLASLLHDIGLNTMPQNVQNEDESAMSDSEKTLFYSHPEKGADALKNIAILDNVTLTAIAQHHMRENGAGFPQKDRLREINSVAEIIGICDDFARLIIKVSKDPSLNIPQYVEKNILPAFSRQIATGFRKAFLSAS